MTPSFFGPYLRAQLAYARLERATTRKAAALRNAEAAFNRMLDALRDWESQIEAMIPDERALKSLASTVLTTELVKREIEIAGRLRIKPETILRLLSPRVLGRVPAMKAPLSFADLEQQLRLIHESVLTEYSATPKRTKSERAPRRRAVLAAGHQAVSAAGMLAANVSEARELSILSYVIGGAELHGAQKKTAGR